MFTANQKTAEQCEKDMWSAMRRGEKEGIVKNIIDLKQFIVACNANPFMARLFIEAQRRRWRLEEAVEYETVESVARNNLPELTCYIDEWKHFGINPG